MRDNEQKMNQNCHSNSTSAPTHTPAAIFVSNSDHYSRGWRITDRVDAALGQDRQVVAARYEAGQPEPVVSPLALIR